MKNINVTAATGTMKTYFIVDAIPSKIGLGETTLLKTGITEPLNEADQSWIGLTIIVTKPDGTNETLDLSRLTPLVQPTHVTHRPH